MSTSNQLRHKDLSKSRQLCQSKISLLNISSKTSPSKAAFRARTSKIKTSKILDKCSSQNLKAVKNSNKSCNVKSLENLERLSQLANRFLVYYWIQMVKIKLRLMNFHRNLFKKYESEFYLNQSKFKEL